MPLISFKPLITFLIALMHPFFVSVIEINHNAKEESIEISVRTFTDDLEKMIHKDLGVTLDINDPKQKTLADTYINKYIAKKLSLSAGATKYNIEFLGFEIQKESTWSYFEVKKVKQLKSLDVYCELLFGINPQQINIFHVNVGGQRKSFELIAPKNTTQFNF